MDNYKLKPRSSFWLTRFLNLFGAKNAWTTISNTIYYPDGTNPTKFPEVIAHEQTHIAQYKKLTVPFFLFLYCLIPLPVFFSYFRWRFEREAYIVEAKMYLAEGRTATDTLIESMVDVMWSGYLFPWPKFLMRKWFKKQLGG
jgi:hypothetical protein